MNSLEYIEKQLSTYPQLCHASNIVGKRNSRLGDAHRNALKDIIVKYAEYLRAIMSVEGGDEQAVRLKVECLNDYYNFFHNSDYDNMFSSQGKLRPTILEEFLYLLFKDVVEEKKLKMKKKTKIK